MVHKADRPYKRVFCKFLSKFNRLYKKEKQEEGDKNKRHKAYLCAIGQDPYLSANAIAKSVTGCKQVTRLDISICHLQVSHSEITKSKPPSLI